MTWSLEEQINKVELCLGGFNIGGKGLQTNRPTNNARSGRKPAPRNVLGIILFFGSYTS